MKNNLSKSEEVDFAYLLELMPVLHEVPEYAWLPELFSIIGADSLITLCKYAGGETIKIPTIDELSLSITALQVYYDINIKQIARDIPESILPLYNKIKSSIDC